MCESSATADEITLYSLAEEKIATGEKFISDLDEFKQISGVNKIQKKITSEIIYLQNAIASKSLKINNILCSNLVHFGYLIETIRGSKNVKGVDFPVRVGDSKKSSFRVDVVADDGATWIKVIARNPKALNDIAFGRSNYGAKSILDHAISYSRGANDNQFRFQNPKIVFDFANQIDEELKNSLRDLNIEVRINGKAVVHEESQFVDIKLLNLDVTTLMAFVSSLTCESCNWEFDLKILTEQAARESLASTKEFLDNLFQGKELIACETAIECFLTILNIVGGQNEKTRAETFLKMIKVYPDLTEEQKNSVWPRRRLGIGGKIRERMFTIITFGLFHKAITVTANKGALEAAKMQGFSIPSIIHEARALTEQKQLTAKYVQRKMFDRQEAQSK